MNIPSDLSQESQARRGATGGECFKLQSDHMERFPAWGAKLAGFDQESLRLALFMVLVIIVLFQVLPMVGPPWTRAAHVTLPLPELML